jgi:hypothetical protein
VAPGDVDTAVLEDVDPEDLVRTINTVMPFGRFKGRKLLELPEPYLVWFHTEGFPRGKLGEQLGLMYEIKVNGLETILRPLMRSDERD